jgi:hypothetical protein
MMPPVPTRDKAAWVPEKNLSGCPNQSLVAILTEISKFHSVIVGLEICFEIVHGFIFDL